MDKLSGGMRRRLLLARGLVHDPQLLLLDEPTVGLDPQIRTELWSLIDSLRTRGKTILMSTHYIEEAERLADEVAVMAHGKIISRGKPSDLVAEHAGRETAEVYAPPERLAEVRANAEAQGLRVRPAGPAIAIVGSEKATNGAVPAGGGPPRGLARGRVRAAHGGGGGVRRLEPAAISGVMSREVANFRTLLEVHDVLERARAGHLPARVRPRPRLDAREPGRRARATSSSWAPGWSPPR